MRFVLATGWEDGVADLTRELVHGLAAGKTVLWLISGGSNIQASVEAMGAILPRLTRGLSIMPVDERFGPPGHANSNWAQLMDAGFPVKQANLLPVLSAGATYEEAFHHYKRMAKSAFAAHDLVIAQLGIGADGHIAGILPDSPAAREKKDLVVGYESPPYTRMTLTFPALLRTDASYVFAFGHSKSPTLTQLRDKRRTLQNQPAQIVKQMRNVSIYNDQIGSN